MDRGKKFIISDQSTIKHFEGQNQLSRRQTIATIAHRARTRPSEMLTLLLLIKDTQEDANVAWDLFDGVQGKP